jgi:hypothetical protein
MRRFRDLSLIEWVTMVLVICLAVFAAWTGPYGIKFYRAQDEPAGVTPPGK